MKGVRQFLRDLHREQLQLLREGLCTRENVESARAARRDAVLADRALPSRQRDRLTKDVQFDDEPTYAADDVLGSLSWRALSGAGVSSGFERCQLQPCRA